MNKKGFTLIEIIASVLILLILAVLTTPSIINMIEKAKATAAETAETRILDATKEYIYSYNRNVLSNLVEEGDTSYVSVDALLSFGLIEEEDAETLPNKDAYIGVQLGTSSNISYTLEYDVEEVTLDKPYVVVLGDNPYYTEYGHTYVDPGIIAFDSDGTNITDDVVVTGTVNTNSIGQYLLSYSVTGTNGEVSEIVTRTVIVRDTTLPVVTVATISSNNVYRSDRAKKGDTVTLLLTFSKSIANTPTVTIGGRTAIVTGSGTTRTATYTIPVDETTLIEGILAINVSNYRDSFSNEGPTVTQITSGNNVIYDVTPVVFTSFYVGGTSNPTYSKVNPITLYISATRAAQMCISTTTTCTAWETYSATKTYTLPSGDGTKTIYIKFRNEAALESSQYSDSIILDMTAPTCSTSGGSSSWVNTSMTITGVCSDALSGCTTASSSYTYSTNTNTTTAGPGTNGAAWTVTDNAGNSSTCLANQTVKIDKTAPTCSTSGGSSTWFNTNRTITGTCSDTGGSECVGNITYTFTTDTNTTTAGPGTTGSTGTISDRAGNTATCLANQTVKIDKTAPTCASSGGNTAWTNGNRTITGTCSDTGGSLCSSATITKTYSTNINSTTESPGTVTDGAGNSTICPATQTVKIDKTAPTCASSGGNAAWTNGNRTITGTCSDTGGSLCSSATVTKTYSSNINSTTESPGTVTDGAGNSTICPATQTVKIDKTAPTCATSGGSTSWFNTDRTITGTCSDEGGSGCVGNISHTFTSNINTTTAGPGTTGSTGTVSDNAGNSVTCLANQTVKIDKTGPTCTTSGGSSTWTNQNVTITGTCNDSGGSTCTTASVSHTFTENINTTTAGPGTSGGTITLTDTAGNSVVCPANQTVKIDKTAPTCASSGGNAAWTNGNRTLTGTCSDTGGSLCSSATITKTYSANINSTTESPGTVTDVAGNSTVCPATQTVKIDKTAPTCATSGGSSTWTNGTRTITGTCSDTGGSGCVGNISYTYNPAANTFVNITNGGPGTSGAAGTVSDNAGNSVTCPANQIVKIDKILPTCTKTGGSTNWFNTDRTISATCNDANSGCSVASSSYTYTTNTSTTTAGPGINGAAWTMTDGAGNSATCLANETVKIDKTAPTCTSSGGNAAWTNGTRTITGTCSDTGGSSCSSATITKTYSTEINSTTESPGTVTDGAGNSVTCLANQTVKIDKTNPTCAVSGGSTSWINTSRTITGTCSDTAGSVNSGCVGNISYTYNPAANTVVNITNGGPGTSGAAGTVSDNAGNSVSCPANQTVKIDKILPPETAHTPASRAWANTNISIALSATDANSGTASYQYCTTTNGTTCTPATAGGTVSLTATGQYTVCSRAKDNAGNTGPTTCSAANAYKIDKVVPPATAHTPTSRGWANTDISIALSSTDANSGTASYQYCTTTNGTTCTPATAGGTVSLTSTGQYTVCSRAIDSVGNVGTTTCSAANAYKIDKVVPPATAHTPASRGWANTDISIALSSTDANSGTASYQYCTTTNGTTCTPATAGGTVSLTATGQYTVCSRAKDNAGNTGPTTCSAANAYKIDKVVPPATAHTPASRGWANTDISIALSSTDANSGTASYQYCTTTNGTPCTPATAGGTVSLTATGQYTVCSRAIDSVGNVGTTTCSAANAYKIDKTAPTCATSGGSSTWTNGTRTITGTCSDTGGSGCVGNISYTYNPAANTFVNITNGGPGTSGAAGTVSDNAGNSVTCPANQIVKIDKIAPTCTKTGGSTNWFNTDRTISATCNDANSGCSVASSSYTYTTNTSTTTAGPGINGAAWTMTDGAGNSATCLANETVKIDKTAPTCTSSGGNAAWTNGTRTLTGTCTDTGGSSCSSAKITKTYSTEINSTTESPGTVTDGAGNSVTCLANQTVKIDKTNPTCAVSGGSTSWINTSRTITGTCSDTAGSVNSGCVGNISYTYNPAANTVVNITNGGPGTSGAAGTVIDNAGNSVSCPANQTVKIDKVLPPETAHTPASRAWANTNISIALSATDANSGTASYQYCTTTNGTTCTPATAGGTVSLTATGQYTVCSRAKDNAGNTGPTTCSAANAYKIDKVVPPATAHTPASRGWANTDISIALSSTDANSGTASYQYCTTTNGTTCTPATAGGTVSLTATGQYTVCSRAIDSVGNVGTTTCSAANAYKIDKVVPPATAHTPASRGWANTDISIALSSTDANSGTASYQYCTTTNGTTCTPATAGGTVSLTATGQYTVCSRAKDNAGNTGATTCSAANAYKIDKTNPPATAHNPASRGWANTDISIALSSTDANSGTASYQYCTTTNGTPCTPATAGGTVSLTATGQYTVCSRAIDSVGNVGTTTCSAANAYKIDKTAPTCATSGGSSTWTNGTRTITGTCSDTGGSGCVGNISYTYNPAANTFVNITNGGPGTSGAAGTVYDNAGNSVTCPANQIVKIDKIAPTCTKTGGSTNWFNTDRTISATCNDANSGCSVASSSYTYTTNTSTTTAGPGINGAAWTMTDGAGNSATCLANETVKIDKTAPTCTSSGGNAAWTNGTRTLTGTCTDTGGSSCSSAKITKTYSTEINSTTESPGTVTDGAGNSVTCLANQTVKIDKTNPTCAVSGGSTSWINTSRTITGTCSDTAGSVNSGCVGNISYTYNPAANTVVNITNGGPGTSGAAGTVIDNAGNSVSCPANQTVKIDKVLPPETAHTPASRAWANTNISIALSATDANSGTASYQYCTTTNGTTCTPATAGGTVSLTATGQYTVCSRAKDKAGNTGPTTCSAANAYKIDKVVPPATAHTPASRGWANTDISIALSSTDANSGTASYQYCTTTNGTTCTPATAGGTVSLTSTGQYTVCSRAKDNAGNTGPTTCSAANAYKIDKTAPTCTTSGGSTTIYSADRTITGTCSDALSGCTGNVSKTYTVNIGTSIAGPGTNGGTGVVYDNAGNSSICSANQTVRILKTVTWAKYNATVSSNTYIKGTYIGIVNAVPNTYPRTGRHTDGYWYELIRTDAYAHYTFDENKETTTNVVTNTDLYTGWSTGYQGNIVFNEISPPDGVNSPTVGFNRANASGYWYSYGDYAPQVPGQVYTVSLYVKTLDSNFRIKFYTADNTEVGRYNSEYITVPNDGQWHRVIWNSFTNPANSQSSSLSFNFIYANAIGDPNTRTWFSAPQMEQKSYATAFINGTRSGIVDDISGNNFDTPLVTANMPAWSSGAYVFDGVDDYIPLPTNINSMVNTSSFTVSAVIKNPSLGSGMSMEGIVSMSYGLSMSIHNNGNIYIYMDNGTSVGALLTTGVNLFDNQYHLVTMTYDRSILRVYVDGNLVGNVSRSFNNRYSNQGVIGYESNNSNKYKYSGLIDDVRIYNRVLSAEELRSIYMSNIDNFPSGDTISPTITLTGANPLTVNKGTTFTDPGYTASDNIDGNITSNVTVSGTVNTATVGTYTRTYNVIDSSNNVKTVTRTVNVIEPNYTWNKYYSSYQTVGCSNRRTVYEEYDNKYIIWRDANCRMCAGYPTYSDSTGFKCPPEYTFNCDSYDYPSGYYVSYTYIADLYLYPAYYSNGLGGYYDIWSGSGYYIERCTAVNGYVRGSYIEQVTSTNASAYPVNGRHTDGYWYVRQ